MEHFTRQLRWAGRGLLKDPGISAIAVVALALGIGLTTVMFSIVYGALHRGLPFDDSDRIVHLERSNPSEGVESMGVPIHDFVDWRERQRSFEHLGAFYTGTVNIRGTERAERFDGGFFSADALAVLGVEPVLGRGLLPEDTRPGAPMVVLLGYDVWQERYGGERSVLDADLNVNGQAARVVGVMPEGFEFPLEQEVWLPLRLDPVALPRGTGMTLEVFGKLREGVGIDAAHVELSGIAEQLGAEYPETNRGVVPVIKPFTQEYIGTEERALLYAMLATVMLVLLVACANVANLLLARASVRTREVAIQTAMGASRRRVIGQLLAQALVLSLAGAALGVGIAWVGIDLFDRALQGVDIPFWMSFRLDAPILGFVAAISVLAALASGILPAVRASSTDISSVLKDEGRGSSSLRIGRLSRILVVAEVAMSVALLVASGLLIRSAMAVDGIDWGMPTEEIFTARAGLFEEAFPDEASRLRFWEEVEERVQALPGVEAAALTSYLPGTNSVGSSWTRLQLQGVAYEAEQELPTTRWARVTPSFFETFDVEILQGRAFTDLDGPDAAPVAVVNRSFVAEHVPEGDAVGRMFKPGGLESDEPWLEIVGVVSDLHFAAINQGPSPDQDGFYRPLAQSDARFLSIAAHANAEPLQLAGPIRDAVASVDPDTPIYWPRTLQATIDKDLWFFDVFGKLFAVFGLAALFMASVGLYGVMSFSVAQRTQEMGIRMALGAEARRVLALVVRQGLGQVVVGMVIGSGLALLVARGLRIVLYDAEPFDPATYAIAFTVLAATGLLAIVIPALRATRIDPISALRYE